MSNKFEKQNVLDSMEGVPVRKEIPLTFEASEKETVEITQNVTKEGWQGKLRKAASLGAVAVVALAGEACSPDKRNDVEQANGQGKAIEMQKGHMSPDPALLAEYRKNIHTGNFPSEGQLKRTIARALEIIILKGMSVDEGSKIEVEACRTVPVEIKVDGKFIPVGPDDYTAEELRLVRLTLGTSAPMENAPDKNDKHFLENDEKISPMAEKIFKKM